MTIAAMTIATHILGFPRMGQQREWKSTLERTAQQLEDQTAALRARHWQLQRYAGLDHVSVGDFALFDPVLDHIQLLGCAPAGQAGGAPPDGAPPALKTAQWFDTNCQYQVPEFDRDTRFSLHAERLLAEVRQAQALGHPVKATLLGPLSFLWLGQSRDGVDRLALLDQLLPVYTHLLAQLKAAGVQWVQVDEPILGLDLPDAWRHAYEGAYWQLSRSGAQILLATYFASLGDKLRLACQLPVAGLHIDLVRAPQDLTGVLDWLPAYKLLSLGLLDGRNIWRSDLDAALRLLTQASAKHRGPLWIAPSCSLLHVPFSQGGETALDADLCNWLAFAGEKLQTLQCLHTAAAHDSAPVMSETLRARMACTA